VNIKIKCPECDKRFERLLDVDQHFAEKHPVTAMYKDKPYRGKLVGKKLVELVAELREREGHMCFFCGHFVPMNSRNDLCRPTVEHLLSRSHGGTNHSTNTVLAHKVCNKIAGNLSIRDKVLLRDALRRNPPKEVLCYCSGFFNRLRLWFDGSEYRNGSKP